MIWLPVFDTVSMFFNYIFNKVCIEYSNGFQIKLQCNTRNSLNEYTNFFFNFVIK